MLNNNHGLPKDASDEAASSIGGDQQQAADDETCFFSWEARKSEAASQQEIEGQQGKFFESTVAKLLIQPCDELKQSEAFVSLSQPEAFVGLNAANDSDESTFIW